MSQIAVWVTKGQVRGERGEVILRGDGRLSWRDLQRIDEGEFPYLGGLLPYADTMFNAGQVVKVCQEVRSQRIRELLGDESAAEIERLCLTVERGPHRYLWFLGD